MIEAVLFDLDDTLFAQQDWLDGAWRAVATAGAAWGIDAQDFEKALLSVSREGSDRGRIIDRALERIGATGDIGTLVSVFKSYAPARLEPYPGVADAITGLSALVRLGLVTDGDVAIQRAKLEALRLGSLFDSIVFSDQLGREYRKPHPAPFVRALGALGVDTSCAVFVGDRPDKDVAGAQHAGMRAVRVRTGEYRHCKDDPQPWATADDVVEAIAMIRPLLSPRHAAAPLSGDL